MSVRTRSQTKNQTKSVLKSVLKPVKKPIVKRSVVYGSRFPHKPAVIRLSSEELDEMGLSCDASGKYQIVIDWYKVEYNDFDTVGKGELYLAPEGYYWKFVSKWNYNSVNAFRPVPIPK
jgi:hypothetical protein